MAPGDVDSGHRGAMTGPEPPDGTVRRQLSVVVLTVSLALLAVAAVALAGPGEARADLVGDPVEGGLSSSTGSSHDAAFREDVGEAESSPAAPVTSPYLGAPPPAPSAEAIPPPPAAIPGPPTSLRIPDLGVDAPVTPVGIAADGSMELPGAGDAGWYRHGRAPGSTTGSAVVSAHVDYNGERGVFYDLRLLEVGAAVSLTDDRGATHRYVVTERFQVGKDDLPTAELFRRGGAHVLTLITCGGAFDRSERSYSDNIVVRAVPA